MGDEIRPYVGNTYHPLYMPFTFHSTTPAYSAHPYLPPYLFTSPPSPRPNWLVPPSPTNTAGGLSPSPVLGPLLPGSADTGSISSRWAQRGAEGETCLSISPSTPTPHRMKRHLAINIPKAEEGNQAQYEGFLESECACNVLHLHILSIDS